MQFDCLILSSFFRMKQFEKSIQIRCKLVPCSKFSVPVEIIGLQILFSTHFCLSETTISLDSRHVSFSSLVIISWNKSLRDFTLTYWTAAIEWSQLKPENFCTLCMHEQEEKTLDVWLLLFNA